MAGNPFNISFGRKPYQYIERHLLIDEILSELESEMIQNQCFMLTGVRGSGKTVTMTAIENYLRAKKDWIVIDLNADRDLLTGLVAKLYDSKKHLKNFFQSEINLSAFGIGVSVKNIPPVADIESALELILREIKKRGKRLLITVDEVYNNGYMREFAASFQIMVRQELPVFLIMAGLYENIHDLEDEKNLTFLYRAPKYDLGPLYQKAVQQSYQQILKIDGANAARCANLTKGYPFAYQALGRFLWEEKGHQITEAVLLKFDQALAAYVYDKIWDEMSEKDRWYMSYIVQKDPITTKELLEHSGSKASEFSQYRTRLAAKGVIDISKRGQISLRLPRFDEFVKAKTDLIE